MKTAVSAILRTTEYGAIEQHRDTDAGLELAGGS
jgi:hypothetical protein